MTNKNKNWEEEFEETFVVSNDLSEQTHLSYPCYVTKFQEECLKDWIQKELDGQREEILKDIHDKFVEFAIQGVNHPDEIKGFELYTKTINYLSKLK